MIQKIYEVVQSRSLMVYIDKQHGLQNDFLSWFADHGDLQNLENFLERIITRSDYVGLLSYIPEQQNSYY